MDREREIISLIHNILDTENKSEVFESDAQPFSINQTDLLFTIDEYSPEDFFLDDEPYHLASNLVMATLSDIIAAGGVPAYFGHSMTIPPSWNKSFIDAGE